MKQAIKENLDEMVKDGFLDEERREELERQLEEKRKFLQGARAKLDNVNFISRAPAEVVQEQRDRVSEMERQIQAIEQNLHELQQA